MGTIASQIISLTIVYSTVYSDADKKKHQSAASLGFVLGIHRGPVNYPHKWSVTRKMFPFDDVIMSLIYSIIAPAAGFIVKHTDQSFQENLSHLFFSVSVLYLLKMIDLKTSNIIWICYTVYRQLETSHMRSIDTNLFLLCEQLYVKFHAF